MQSHFQILRIVLITNDYLRWNVLQIMKLHSKLPEGEHIIQFIAAPSTNHKQWGDNTTICMETPLILHFQKRHGFIHEWRPVTTQEIGPKLEEYILRTNCA